MRFYDVEELIFTLTSAQTKKNICIYVPPSFLKKIFIAYEKVSKNLSENYFTSKVIRFLFNYVYVTYQKIIYVYVYAYTKN